MIRGMTSVIARRPYAQSGTVPAAGLDLGIRPRARAELIYETYYDLAAAAQGGTGRSPAGRFPGA